MLSRSNIDESRYSRDQRLFAGMIEKMINAAKEGTKWLQSFNLTSIIC